MHKTDEWIKLHVTDSRQADQTELQIWSSEKQFPEVRLVLQAGSLADMQVDTKTWQASKQASGGA